MHRGASPRGIKERGLVHRIDCATVQTLYTFERNINIKDNATGGERTRSVQTSVMISAIVGASAVVKSMLL